MNHAVNTLILAFALLAAGLAAQEPKPAPPAPPARVTTEQWDEIKAAETAGDFARAVALQEKIITGGAFAPVDRVTALQGYIDHATRSRGQAAGDKAGAWLPMLSEAAGSSVPALKTLVQQQLRLADLARDPARRAAVLQEAVGDGRLDMRARSEFAGQAAEAHLLRTDDIPGGAALIAPLLATPGIAERDVVFVCKAQGDYWKLAGDLEKAIAAYAVIHERAPAQKASAIEYIRAAYLDFGEPEKARDYFLQHADTLAKAQEDRELAVRLIDDASTPHDMRRQLFHQFLGDTPEDAAVRARHAALYADKDLNPNRYRFKLAPRVGNCQYVLEMLGYGEKSRWAEDLNGYLLLKVKALAGLNREAEAAEAITAWLTQTKAGRDAKPRDRHFLALAAAVLPLPDRAGVAKGVIDAVNASPPPGAEFTPAEQAQLLMDLASLVSHTRKHDLTLDIHGLHEKLFVAQPRKEALATFCDEPVDSFDAFLRIRDQLKPELLDRRFKGDLEMIVATDIASGGERAAALGAGTLTEAGKLFILCDEAGVRFYFDIPDPDGIAFGAGLAGRSHTFELFFAPGWNQPYCGFGARFGASAREGWIYQTTYNNLTHQRFEEHSPNYRTDARYYDKGFLASFFFGWDAMFDKLPDSPEKFLEFDIIDWAPGGGMAWSSRLNVHSRLEWGRVRFALAPEQLARIRRRIIFNARREYMLERDRPNGPVDFWKDEVLGDPAFYHASVAPLVARLDAALSDVATNMDAAVVDRLFREAVPGWKRLRYIVAELRAGYLDDWMLKE